MQISEKSDGNEVIYLIIHQFMFHRNYQSMSKSFQNFLREKIIEINCKYFSQAPMKLIRRNTSSVRPCGKNPLSRFIKISFCALRKGATLGRFSNGGTNHWIKSYYCCQSWNVMLLPILVYECISVPENTYLYIKTLLPIQIAGIYKD